MQRISEGALSPDGTVLATASHDGYVKFWQIYIEGQDQPRYVCFNYLILVLVLNSSMYFLCSGALVFWLSHAIFIDQF